MQKNRVLKQFRHPIYNVVVVILVDTANLNKGIIYFQT